MRPARLAIMASPLAELSGFALAVDCRGPQCGGERTYTLAALQDPARVELSVRRIWWRPAGLQPPELVALCQRALHPKMQLFVGYGFSQDGTARRFRQVAYVVARHVDYF